MAKYFCVFRFFLLIFLQGKQGPRGSRGPDGDAGLVVSIVKKFIFLTSSLYFLLLSLSAVICCVKKVIQHMGNHLVVES